MARTKGSKNKIQSPYGKNYANPTTQLAMDKTEDQIAIEDYQSIQAYNASLNEQDSTLDAFLIETVDNTLASIENNHSNTKSIQHRLLSLMSQIHSEIAPAINQMRKALANSDTTKHVGYVLDNEQEDYTKLIGIA